MMHERKAPAKRSQHANATYRNIVGRNMLGAFGQRVAMCCDMLGVVGSRLKMVKFVPTTRNMSQHRGQTSATCCAQQCCDMLRWHVAIVWPGLKAKDCTRLWIFQPKSWHRSLFALLMFVDLHNHSLPSETMINNIRPKIISA